MGKKEEREKVKKDETVKMLIRKGRRPFGAGKREESKEDRGGMVKIMKREE